MKIKFAFFILLLNIAFFSCSESVDEVPLVIDNVENDILTLGPNASMHPPHFNLSLAFEQYYTAGDGTETGHISLGINRTLDKTITIDLKYEGRISSTANYQTLIPVYPTFTIPAGTTSSDVEALVTEMIDPCQTEIDLRLSVERVVYGMDTLTNSDYTMVSGPFSSQILNTPNASCMLESNIWIKGDVISPGDDFDFFSTGG